MEKLTSDHQEARQLVEQLRSDNKRLEQSVKDKIKETTLNR